MNLLELLKSVEPSKAITWKTVVQDEIWVAENFFSKEECEKLIEISENASYEEALVNISKDLGVMDKRYRDSKRVMIDDVNLAGYIFEKCKDNIPSAFEGGLLLEVNERMRFLKYDHPGAKFAKHCDANFPRKSNEESLITMQIYLNEGFEGGETTIFDEIFPDEKFPYVPKMGSVLFFRQRGWEHEGSVLKSGIKYTIRTELMYRWIETKDKETFEHKKCGVCGSVTQFVELASCDHLFLMCRCNPLNYKDKFGYYECMFCQKEIRFQPELQLVVKKYGLREVDDELLKAKREKTGCVVF